MFPAYFLGILIFALHTKNLSGFIKTTIALLTFFSFSLPMAVPIIKMPKGGFEDGEHQVNALIVRNNVSKSRRVVHGGGGA